jgi:hypothetical protein
LSSSIGSLYPYFGIALQQEKIVKKSIKVKDVKIDISMFPVLKVEKETFFHSMGVKPGDFIGILYDHYENLTRYIQVLHLPRDKSIKGLSNLGDYIYSIKRSKYDENIL